NGDLQPDEHAASRQPERRARQRGLWYDYIGRRSARDSIRTEAQLLIERDVGRKPHRPDVLRRCLTVTCGGRGFPRRLASFKEVQMIHLRRACFVIGIFVALVPTVSGQTPQGAAPEISLSVSGEVERPLKLSAADLSKLPHTTLRSRDQDGKELEYEGA